MPMKPDPLTPGELDEIARLRADARARARLAIAAADPAEDAAVVAAAEADPDAQPMTDAELARMRPAHEVHPHRVATRLRRGRGRPRSEAPKQQVTLRLDADVIAGLRARGAGWQVRVNEVLRRWLETPQG
jgi:uncharacterized protein (DUF4415 family)